MLIYFFYVKGIVDRQFDLTLARMLSIVIKFLCNTAKSIPRQNYKEGIPWDQHFFAGSETKIPIAFGIRGQNFE